MRSRHFHIEHTTALALFLERVLAQITPFAGLLWMMFPASRWPELLRCLHELLQSIHQIDDCELQQSATWESLARREGSWGREEPGSDGTRHPLRLI